MATFPSGIKSFSSKTDGVDDVMASHVNDLQDEVTAVETQLLGDLVDYSALSTIIGWSSFTTKKLLYKKVGKLTHVQFYFEGTSNSTGTSFTLPDNNNANIPFTINPCLTYTNSTWAMGYMSLPASSATVLVHATSAGGGGWTASGAKSIYGQFWYEVT